MIDVNKLAKDLHKEKNFKEKQQEDFMQEVIRLLNEINNKLDK